MATNLIPSEQTVTTKYRPPQETPVAPGPGTNSLLWIGGLAAAAYFFLGRTATATPTTTPTTVVVPPVSGGTSPPLGIPGAPEELQQIGGTAHSVIVECSPVQGAVQYNWYEYGTNLLLASSPTNIAVIQGLQSNTTYEVYCEAVNIAGEVSPPSPNLLIMTGAGSPEIFYNVYTTVATPTTPSTPTTPTPPSTSSTTPSLKPSQVVLSGPTSATVGQVVTVQAQAYGVSQPVYQFWYLPPGGDPTSVPTAQNGWISSGTYSLSNRFSFGVTEVGTYTVVAYARAVNAPINETAAERSVYETASNPLSITVSAASGGGGGSSSSGGGGSSSSSGSSSGLPGYIGSALYAHIEGPTSTTLTWNAAPGATLYRIVAADGTVLATTSSTSYTLTGLTPGQTYTIHVIPCNSAGCNVNQGPITFQQPTTVTTGTNPITQKPSQIVTYPTSQGTVTVATTAINGQYVTPSPSQAATLGFIQQSSAQYANAVETSREFGIPLSQALQDYSASGQQLVSAAQLIAQQRAYIQQHGLAAAETNSAQATQLEGLG